MVMRLRHPRLTLRLCIRALSFPHRREHHVREGVEVASVAHLSVLWKCDAIELISFSVQGRADLAVREPWLRGGSDEQGGANG